MTTVALPYHKVITDIFFFNDHITGPQQATLTAAFRDRDVTREEFEDTVPGLLEGWPAAKLRRCLERARALFDKADLAANPPPMADDKAILKRLSRSMTISLKPKDWAKLLYYRRGANLLVRYEYDGGMPDPWIPSVYIRDFTELGGSAEAFIAFIEAKGGKKGRGNG